MVTGFVDVLGRRFSVREAAQIQVPSTSGYCSDVDDRVANLESRVDSLLGVVASLFEVLVRSGAVPVAEIGEVIQDTLAPVEEPYV